MATKDEAERLAAALARFWRDRGHPAVRAWVVRRRHRDAAGCHCVYGVRSNLVAGLPPRTIPPVVDARRAPAAF